MKCWKRLSNAILVLIASFSLSAFSIEATNLSIKSPRKGEKQKFYYDVKGEFFTSKILMKGNRRVEKHLNKYHIIGLVHDDPNAYELALNYERMGDYTNTFFWGMTAGALGGIYGVISSEDGVVLIGGLVALLSFGPYLYYKNKTTSMLNETINIYNEVKPKKQSLFLNQSPLNLSYSWKF
jgi:hypothetical protein